MADISDVIRADDAHILCWQARLGQLHRGADPASCPDLAATWDTVTTLIDVHARAEEEICDPAIYGTGPQGRTLAAQARDGRQDICELIGDTGLQLPGSPRWWDLASAALAAWALHLDDDEHGPQAGYRRRADRGLREHLARQWRAFTEAVIRDQSYPAAPPQLPTCQLRLARPATPRLAHPAFCPLACTCQSCTGRLDLLFVRRDWTTLARPPATADLSTDVGMLLRVAAAGMDPSLTNRAADYLARAVTPRPDGEGLREGRRENRPAEEPSACRQLVPPDRAWSSPGPAAVRVRLDQQRRRGQPQRGEQEAAEHVGRVMLAPVHAGQGDQDRHEDRGNEEQLPPPAVADDQDRDGDDQAAA
jgi:hypothetical protein